MLFAKKTALVTGAGSGIGKATALAFARHGANVVVLGRTRSEIDATAEEIEGLGGRGGGRCRSSPTRSTRPPCARSSA